MRKIAQIKEILQEGKLSKIHEHFNDQTIIWYFQGMKV
jgi:hypothetical protein